MSGADGVEPVRWGRGAAVQVGTGGLHEAPHLAHLAERRDAQRAELLLKAVGDVLQARCQRLIGARPVHGVQHGQQRPEHVGRGDLGKVVNP